MGNSYLMRSVHLLSAAVSLAAIGLTILGHASGSAMAQSPGAIGQTKGDAGPRADKCAGRTDVLGVSRVVEISTANGQLFGQQQYGDNDFLKDGEIVLTFDDGPLRPYTVPVLNALDAHCTKATFFIVGRMAVADPELVRDTARRGHTIGTHTWSHRNMRSAGSLAKGEVELAISAVRKAAGQPTAPFFRFPFLADSRAMIGYLKTRDNGIFSIDIDSVDYRTKDPAEVHTTILNQLAHKRKGILLFHDIQPSTAGAISGLLGELKKRGFKVVHMISKAPATTLPEYDALADKELSRKQLAAAKSPLANRAIVWPVSPGDAPAGRTDTRPAALRVPPALAPSSGAVAAQGNPPPQAISQPGPPPTAPAAAPPRSKWRAPDDDWATKMFRDY